MLFCRVFYRFLFPFHFKNLGDRKKKTTWQGICRVIRSTAPLISIDAYETSQHERRAEIQNPRPCGIDLQSRPFFFHEIYIFEGRVLIYREKSYLLCQASPIKESCPLSAAKYVSSTTECSHSHSPAHSLFTRVVAPFSLFSLDVTLQTEHKCKSLHTNVSKIYAFLSFPVFCSTYCPKWMEHPTGPFSTAGQGRAPGTPCTAKGPLRSIYAPPGRN